MKQQNLRKVNEKLFKRLWLIQTRNQKSNSLNNSSNINKGEMIKIINDAKEDEKQRQLSLINAESYMRKSRTKI